ncbi:DHA2 family methylenomycin A resistance protein-like MFS transporter [Curtobacterium sp. PhB142]|uniref:MFS transporter n=1 Tax=unclassified Curtobacterium TaxID=257496 RepID=UPI0010CE28C4|nr:MULTISPECIES: MFS transporter [unclassified Curtobacterium]TCL82417.1 DHA2 family methylenomycin A resistance protein-like MFS transporter [Curtobacterium sp. PhB142]TCM00366.1 DHA2 family methylenomycin A resistance protein-like MFS transporter [Curtobacterium sp. PhB134]TCU83595.1 DHA2 family methylenomycin A resistance protein-like MFS transporter [Curtobacterium sp. PhB191]TDW44484.1 DHA2 family methylenomycin A resistance protein-like MFS transporter [Curtobacterium sp. PhB42]TDW54185.
MTAPTAADVPTDRGPHRAARLTLVLASLGFFLITLDILIVNVALTTIGRELGGSTAGLQWVIDAYTLLFASLLLFAGNLSERIGAKRAIGWGIAGFLVASVACALAPSLGALIAARAVQGAAAAVMLPASMALIRQAFPEARERAHALGIWAVGGAVAGAVGPILGGALTTLDWRLVFAINLPVCAVMLGMLVRVAPSPRRPARFDAAGQVLALLALGGLVFGLIEGGASGFGRWDVVVALAVAAASVVGFLLVQAHGRNPMMPLDLFRSGGMRIALGVGFAFMVGNFGSVFVLSLYLQQHLGLSPLAAGLVFLPSAAFSIVGNIVSGTLVNRFGARVPVVAGLTTMAIGLVVMIVLAPYDSIAAVAVCTILTGAGGSVAMPPATSVVLASVPAERSGTASAVFNTFRQVGGAVAIAVFGAFLADRSQFVVGTQTSFVVAAVVLLVAALAAIRIRTE